MAYRGGPGNVDGPVEITGRATFRKRVTYLEGALDLSSVSDAIPWSGGHVFFRSKWRSKSNYSPNSHLRRRGQ